MRDDDGVAGTEVLQHGGLHDVRQCEQPKAARLGRLSAPAHEVALDLALGEPGSQRGEVSGPLVAVDIDDDQRCQGPVQFTAQPTDKRGVPPARLELAARGDGGLAGEDVCVRALEGIESHLQPQLQQAARLTEVVVGCGRQ